HCPEPAKRKPVNKQSGVATCTVAEKRLGSMLRIYPKSVTSCAPLQHTSPSGRWRATTNLGDTRIVKMGGTFVKGKLGNLHLVGKNGQDFSRHMGTFTGNCYFVQQVP